MYNHLPRGSLADPNNYSKIRNCIAVLNLNYYLMYVHSGERHMTTSFEPNAPFNRFGSKFMREMTHNMVIDFNRLTLLENIGQGRQKIDPF